MDHVLLCLTLVTDCKKTNKKNRENILPDVTCFYGWNLFTLHFMCIFIFIFHSVVWLKKKKNLKTIHMTLCFHLVKMRP